MADLDWDAIREEFIHDPVKPKLSDFCVTRNYPYGTARNKSSREKWMTQRDDYWAQVMLKSLPQIHDLDVATTVRDVGQKLAQIQAMKLTALKYAGGTEGHEVAYDKPHEAVAAFERLEKLERLILGESTEHIKIDDARQTVLEMLQIIREEVADHDTLTRIAGRFGQLRALGGGPQPESDRPLN